MKTLPPKSWLRWAGKFTLISKDSEVTWASVKYSDTGMLPATTLSGATIVNDPTTDGALADTEVEPNYVPDAETPQNICRTEHLHRSHRNNMHRQDIGRPSRLPLGSPADSFPV